MTRRAFHDPAGFPFLAALARALGPIRAELGALAPDDFVESPDSLGARPGGYDERGWRWYGLLGEGAPAAHRARCPRTVAACEAVPGVVDAAFSRFRPGTHLEPHRGERAGVLRCHLPLVVPAGDLGLRFGEELRTWRVGECLVFDDGVEHDAWNRGAGDRDVLLVTFRVGAGASPEPARDAAAG